MSRLDHRVLGALVGGMILFYNAPGVLGIVGIGGDAVTVTRIVIVALALVIAAYAWRQRRIDRVAEAAAVPASETPRTPAAIPVDVAVPAERRASGMPDDHELPTAPVPVLVSIDEER